MGDDLIRDLFGGTSEEERIESFQRSTLSLVLRELGASPGRIRGWQYELGESYGFDWFNDQNWIEPTVTATRVFRFNLMGLFKSPRKHPVVAEWNRAVTGADSSVIMIFKCFELGRLIATNLTGLEEHSSIYVPAIETCAFRVFTMSKFFTTHYGTLIESENT